MTRDTERSSLAKFNRWAIIGLGAIAFVHAVTEQYVAAALLLSALYVGQLLVHAIDHLKRVVPTVTSGDGPQIGRKPEPLTRTSTLTRVALTLGIEPTAATRMTPSDLRDAVVDRLAVIPEPNREEER